MSTEAPLSAGGVEHRDEHDGSDRPIAQRPIDGPGHVADDTLGEFPDYIHGAPPGKQIRARAWSDVYDNGASRTGASVKFRLTQKNPSTQGIHPSQNATAKQSQRKRTQNSTSGGSRPSKNKMSRRIRTFCAKRRNLGEGFGKGAAQKNTDQVALVVCAAFEIVDGIRRLSEGFGGVG